MQLRDHLGGGDLLVRVAEHRLFQRLAELLALHEVRPLGDADLVVQQLAQRLQREVLLLQRRHPLEELVAQDVEPRFVEPGGGEQVDHLARVHRAADDLPHGGVDVALPRAAAPPARLVGQPLADHRRDALEERQMRRDRLASPGRGTASANAVDSSLTIRGTLPARLPAVVLRPSTWSIAPQVHPQHVRRLRVERRRVVAAVEERAQLLERRPASPGTASSCSSLTGLARAAGACV